MQEDIATKTGENIYKRSGLAFKDVTFNANQGRFYERDKDAPKDEKTGKVPKLPITEAEAPMTVIFLKIRRVLSFYSPKLAMRTSEHNHKNDKVVLYLPDKKREYGTAAAIRERYPAQLKTHQIVYALIPERDEVVRMTFKGASLGSEAKHPKDVLKFYEYLQSFTGSEHTHQFRTELIPVKEEGPQGPYYAISFKRGAPLDEEMLENVSSHIDLIHASLKASDERLAAGFGTSSQESQAAPGDDQTPEAEDDDGPGIKYPTEDINPDDIPF